MINQFKKLFCLCSLLFCLYSLFFTLYSKNMYKNHLLLIILFSLASLATMAQQMPWRTVDFNDNWKFKLTNNDVSQINADDSHWRTLQLPHDWSIEADFDEKHPASAGGGALPGGIAWYRKTFFMDKNMSNKCVFIDFDGVYQNSEVWINGNYLGKRPFGYIGFRYELSKHLKFGNNNVIAVKVDNSQQPNSRWYSGSGIYRNVWLTTTNAVHVAHWGTFVQTPNVSEKQADIEIETRIVNTLRHEKQILVKQILRNAKGKKVAETQSLLKLDASSEMPIKQSLRLASPELWDIDRPYLYSLETVLLDKGKVSDKYNTTVGLRYFKFDPAKGFFLNGKNIKINGVCNHHDLGALGAAVNTRAIQRQLEILKAMGVNGIRTAHNPPAPELLQLCDRMGFIVQGEAFDMWKKQKTKFDYSLIFDEWHERDLRDMLLRDRNHASVFSWSIGNEVGEQWANNDAQNLDLQQANILLNAPKTASPDDLASGRVNLNAMLTTHLVDIVKKYDTTRPVTAGCNETGEQNPLFVSNALDIIGYNYHDKDFADVPRRFPNKAFMVTESVSALQTRGFYLMPSDSMHIWPVRWDIPFSNDIQKCSAYDNNHTPWGSTHEHSLKMIKKYDHIAGQYIWTGFDYLGEPTPYWWPSRSSYFGIVDLAGFPKDVYYMYKSEWTKENVLHIFPHWNWEPGATVDIWAYYNNADEVEMFLNGKSLGKKSKTNDELHVMWRIAYEPGTLKAVSRKNGQIVLERETKTANKPTSIKLTADRNTIKADGYDLSFVTVELVDEQGVAHPLANQLVTFSVEGGTIVGTDNGCQYDHRSLKKPERNLYYGKALCIVKGTAKSGKIKLKAKVDGLPDAEIEIRVKK